MKKKNKPTINYNGLLKDIDKLNNILDELSNIKVDSRNRSKHINKLLKNVESFDKISDEKYLHLEDHIDEKTGDIKDDTNIQLEEDKPKNNLDTKK